MTSVATTTSKQLNLRYKPVSEEMLSSAAMEGVETLWIGPCNSHSIPPASVVALLPPSVCHLDWDLTTTTTTTTTEHEQGKILPDNVLEALLLKTNVRHLCLRFRGDDGAIQLSQHLAAAASAHQHFPRVLALESLDLRGNHISNKGAHALAAALQTYKGLMSLNLGYNRIGDEGVQALSQMLAVSDTTESSKVCSLSSASAFSSTLSSGGGSFVGLRELNLSCNTFGPDGATHLAHALRTNRSLIHLSLFCSPITAKSCTDFVQALRDCNYTLHHLKLGGTLTNESCHVRRDIQHYLHLNRHGRVHLRDGHRLSKYEWCRILSLSCSCANAQTNAATGSGTNIAPPPQRQQGTEQLDVLYHLVSNKPDLFLPS